LSLFHRDGENGSLSNGRSGGGANVKLKGATASVEKRWKGKRQHQNEQVLLTFPAVPEGNKFNQQLLYGDEIAHGDREKR